MSAARVGDGERRTGPGLRLMAHDVAGVSVGKETSYADGLLTVGKRQATELLAHPVLAAVRVSCCSPGESTRIIKVLDAVEPRCKGREGQPGANGASADGVFPGLLGPAKLCGRGETHLLRGAAVLSAGFLPRAQEAVLQMSGAGAELSPLSGTHNIVVEFEPAPDAPWEQVAGALRLEAALLLWRSGDRAGAAREMRAALDRRPNDAEAKMLLDSLAPGAGSSASGDIVPSSATLKIPAERIKRNYEESAFRQMTTQMEGWAEQQFARSDPRAHAHFHIELGQELMAHGFTTEAEAEFRHAAAVDPSSTAALTALAEDYDARGDTHAARAEAEAALRIHESAEAYLVLVRLDLQENKIAAATQDIERALQLEPANPAGQELKRALTAKLAEKSQP